MITVDDREERQHSGIVVSLRESLGRDNVQVARLDFADYAFYGHDHLTPDGSPPPKIGIELSTVSDVVGKQTSGRLVYQLSNMLEMYDRAILLIESPIYTDSNGKVKVGGAPATVPYNWLFGTLQAAQAHGASVLYGAGRTTIQDYILQIYNFWQRSPLDHRTFRKDHDEYKAITIPLGEPLDSRVKMLMAIPGIGEDKARAAINQYGSVQMIAVLGPKELQKIPGWGQATAKAVSDWFARNAS